jgi:hypothetical protein
MSQETFERELARHADGVHGAPLSFEDVRGKARSIRRRRRAAVTGGVAAAVVLAVIVPSVLTGGQGKSSRAPEPAPPVPGHTAVLHDGQVELPDGTTVDLGVDNQDVQQMGLLTDGRIVLAMSQPYGVRVYSPDGSTHVDEPAAYNVITMSPRDDAVAWVGDDNTARVLESGSSEPATLPGKVDGSIDAVLDADHLLVGDSPTTTGELTPDGIAPLETSEPFRVIDVSPGGELWAVAFVPTVDNEQYGCSGLYDPQADRVVARSCDVSSLQFSPDGEHLLTMRGDNNMFGEASVVDLELDEVGSFTSAGAGDVVSRAAWADASHVLVGRVNWKTSEWSLVRVGLDWGDPKVLDGPGDGGNPEMVAEYLLSE